MAGSTADRTYWKILSDIDGKPTPTPVGEWTGYTFIQVYIIKAVGNDSQQNFQ